MSFLRVTEVFYSLQGEAGTQGRPTVFIRLTGCPLRCHYCDTAYAFSGGSLRSVPDLIQEVASYDCSHVTVTGGEPLAQAEPCVSLLDSLVAEKYAVSIETSGAIDVSRLDLPISIVMDLKTPGSGEVGRNLYGNIARLQQKDQVKFIICDRQDYEWARFKISEYSLSRQVGEVLLSPSWGQMDPAQLAAWILEDKLEVRMQLQLHKLLWGTEPGC